MLANCSLAWWLLQNMVDIPSDTPLENVVFFSRYQLQIVYQLGIGICVQVLLFVWDFVWIETVPVLCVSVSSYLYQPICVWMTLFPCVSQPPPLALKIFLPHLPHRYLRLEGRNVIKDILFISECSKVSHALHII